MQWLPLDLQLTKQASLIDDTIVHIDQAKVELRKGFDHHIFWRKTLTREKLWTRDFIFISLVHLVISLVYYLLLVTVGPYAEDHFHAAPNLAGFVTGVYLIGVMIGRLVTGRFIGSVGYKKTLLAGMVFFVIAMAMHFSAVSISLLILFRFIHGIAVGVASTATGTIIALIVPVSRRGEGISYYGMSSVIGGAIGPFLGILLIQHFSFNTIFLFCILLGAIGLLMSWIVKLPTVGAYEKTQNKTSGRFKLSDFFEASSIPISIVAFGVGFVYSGILSLSRCMPERLACLGQPAISSWFIPLYSWFPAHLADRLWIKGGRMSFCTLVFLL